MVLTCIICLDEANPIKCRTSYLKHTRTAIQFLCEQLNIDYQLENKLIVKFDFCDTCFELHEELIRIYALLQDVKGQITKVTSNIKSKVQKSEKLRKDDSNLSDNCRLLRAKIISNLSNNQATKTNARKQPISQQYSCASVGDEPNNQKLTKKKHDEGQPTNGAHTNQQKNDQGITTEEIKLEPLDHDDFQDEDDFQYSEPESENEADLDDEEIDIKPNISFRESDDDSSQGNTPENDTIKSDTTTTNPLETDRIHCEHCKSSFKCPNYLVQHYRLVHKKVEKTHYCEQQGCEKKFVAKSLLQRHMEIHKKPPSRIQIIDCKLCGKVFEQQSSYNTHMKRSHSTTKEPLSCEICNITVTNTPYLLKHILRSHETHESETPHACLKCEKKFSTNFMLARHTKFHKFDKTKTLACEICELRFFPRDKEALEQHVQKYHHNKRSKVFQCSAEGCTKSFAIAVQLYQHERKHHPELLIYNCNLCGNVYSVEKFLEIHKITHSSDAMLISGGVSLVCTVCNAKFSSRDSLAEHLLKHTGEEKLKCDLCNQRFLYKDHLRKHLVEKHNIEKQCVCEICNEKFSNRRDLVRHNKKTHSTTPIKPPEKVPCPHCGKLYAKTTLAAHIRQVHEPRFTQCEQCGKSVKFNHLDHHMKRHEGIKTHECNYCSKRFVTTFELKIHQYTHTGERPHVCKYCDRSFTQAHCLKTHLKSHNNDRTDIQSENSSSSSMEQVDFTHLT